MATAPMPQTSSSGPAFDLKVLWPYLALFVSVVGVAGSLYLSMGMGWRACPLCFYQRAFIMAVAAILGFGIVLPELPKAVLAPLALAPALAGAWIAGTHTYLVANGTLECPPGVTGLLPPQESLIVYGLIMAILLGDLIHQRRYIVQGIAACFMGWVFASTSLSADPTLPAPAPAPMDGCRKVPPSQK